MCIYIYINKYVANSCFRSCPRPRDMGPSMVHPSKKCRTRPSKACTRHCTRHFFQPDHFVFLQRNAKEMELFRRYVRTRLRTRLPHKALQKASAQGLHKARQALWCTRPAFGAQGFFR